MHPDLRRLDSILLLRKGDLRGAPSSDYHPPDGMTIHVFIDDMWQVEQRTTQSLRGQGNVIHG